MQFTARLIKVNPPQTGNGRNGTWKKQEIIVETTDQYPKKICVAVWGDKINVEQFQEGVVLNISFNLESREYNNRWYTDVKAWKIDLAGNDSRPAAPSPDRDISYQDIPAPPAPAENDLPF